MKKLCMWVIQAIISGRIPITKWLVWLKNWVKDAGLVGFGTGFVAGGLVVGFIAMAQMGAVEDKVKNLEAGMLMLLEAIEPADEMNAGAVPRRGSDVGTSTLLVLSGSGDK